MNDTTIVIRACNEAENLKVLLPMLQQTAQQADILIVVDARTRDQTANVAESFHCRHILFKAPCAFMAEALNAGFSIATTEFVVSLSADALPADEHWLSELLRPLRTNANVVASFSRQISKRESPWYIAQLLGEYYPRSGDSPILLSNVCAAYRRSSWQALPFSAQASGIEDHVWAQAMLTTGRQVVYCPRSCVRHAHHDSFRQAFTRSRRDDAPRLVPFNRAIASFARRSAQLTWWWCSGKLSLREYFEGWSYFAGRTCGLLSPYFSLLRK